MSNFLDVAEGLLRSGRDPQKDALELVFRGIYQLAVVQSKADTSKTKLKLHNQPPYLGLFET